MRVLLTGFSGYLGGVFSRHLSEMPEVEHVTGIDIVEPARPLPPRTHFTLMDIRSDRLGRLMAQHDVVVHTAFILTWLASMPRAERDDINERGIDNVARAVRGTGIDKLVHISSVAAYDITAPRGAAPVTEDAPIGRGDTASYYLNGKALEERTLSDVLRGSTVTVTLLRPTFITGPRDPTTAPGFRAHAALPLGPEPTWQFVHEDDVAAAVELALHIDLPGAYNVVPDDWITASEAFRLLGVKRVPRVPMALAKAVTYVRWRWRGDRTHPSWLPVINASVTFDNSLLTAAGWTPRYTSADAVRSAANAPPTMLRR